MSEGYRQVGSFESGRVDAVGVGDDAIAVGIDDRIVVVSGGDRIEFDHGDRVVDIAVADRVLVLSAETLTTYSRDGDRIRQQSVENVHAIAAIAGEDLVGLLGPERLRAVDITTGRERFDVERARPGGPADDGVLGTPAGFVIATWSFLTRIDPDGEVCFDRNLEAVVRSVGRCDDAIVAALQNDRLVAADLETGQSRWRTELTAHHVAPIGESSVLVRTADGIRAVDSAGATRSVAGLSSGDGYATADGSLVCAVRDGTVSNYAHSRDRLRLAVATESVGVGGTIDVEATNATDEERRVSLAASIDGASLAPSERQTTVEPGETSLVDFPVESVRAEGETTVALSVDGSVVEEAAIELDDAASGGIAVEADLEVSTIDHGVAELLVTVENVGGVTLEDVRLRETDEGTDALEPGSEWTGTVTRPYEPDRRVSVGLEVARGDRRREYAPTCTLPPTPTIEIEPDGDAVRATVATDGSATVVDRLVIELPGAGRVRTEVTIQRDELLLVVPQFEDGLARIGFESIDVDERVRLSGAGPASPSHTAGLGNTRSNRAVHGTSARAGTDRSDPERGGDGTASTDPDSSEPADRRRSNRPTAGTPSDVTGLDSATGNERAGRSSDESATGTDRPTADTTSAEDGQSTGSAATDTRESTDSAGSDESTAAPRISATRRVDGEPAPIGHAVRDRIDLENEGESTAAVTVGIGESTVDVGRLEAGERTTLERSVAALSADDPTLPPASIGIDGEVREELPEHPIPVRDDGVAVRAAVDPTEGTVVAEFENRDDRPCEIRGLEIAGNPVSIEEPLAAGATTTVTGHPQRWSAPEADSLEGVVRVADGTGTERRLDIVVTVDTVATDAGDDDDPFRITIGPETQVAGEYGTVVLVLENDGSRPVSDVAVSATGEPINELFYSEARRDRLGAGDRIEHFVDIEPGVDSPSFEATVKYTIDGTDHEYAVRAAGPSAADEAAWTDEHRGRWSLERIEKESHDLAGPSSLSTPFRRE